MTLERPVELLLRVALAFAFLYPPISAYLHPDAWLWYIPEFVEISISRETFLPLFGVVEVIIALGLLCMKNPIIPALAASVILLGILVFVDYRAFDIVFRDVSILLAAIALILLYRERTHGTIHEPFTIIKTDA